MGRWFESSPGNQQERRKTMHVKAIGERYEGGSHVRCPECDVRKVRLERVEQDAGDTTLDFEGDCGHSFSLGFVPHEGETVICSA